MDIAAINLVNVSCSILKINVRYLLPEDLVTFDAVNSFLVTFLDYWL